MRNMKKVLIILSLMLALAFGATACGELWDSGDGGLEPRERRASNQENSYEEQESEDNGNDFVTTTPEITVTPEETPPVTTPAESDEEITWRHMKTEEERYEMLAETIMQAFLEKDTEFLSDIFEEDGGKAFEFIKELEFSEFERTGNEYNESIYNHVFYFNITVENGTDDIFTQGGREWELHLSEGSWSVVNQFSPRGMVINKSRREWEDFSSFCYRFSNDLSVFETMNDFNLLRDKNTERQKIWRINSGYEPLDEKQIEKNFYHTLFHNLDWFYPYAGYSEGNINTFMELAETHYGMTNIEPEVACDDYERGLVLPDAHGWYWCYPVLISEELTGTNATVVINYYGDTAYMFAAKTMKYTLELKDEGARLISTELLYSNDDLVLARGST
ncbi:MAG: hypothetical protein FWG70_11425 [Oscillospiraceae bacterium]|nr:hypothetical protein [Oscillospiraceae bacterium]